VTPVLPQTGYSRKEHVINALTSGNPADFEAISLGGTVKLVNPQASYAFPARGSTRTLRAWLLPPGSPALNRAEKMAEDYWMALTRDVPYSQYGSEPFRLLVRREIARSDRVLDWPSGWHNATYPAVQQSVRMPS
jgi:hypothetical protein